MMAAKTLVPLSPPDMLGALFMLTFDPDANVRETAAQDRRRAAGPHPRPPRCATRTCSPPVLGYFLELLVARRDLRGDAGAQRQHPGRRGGRAGARSAAPQIAEIIGQNQLRLLRHDDIIRKLVQNPNAARALLDSVCDFAVRSGLVLADVPQMKAARVRLFGPEAATRRRRIRAPPPSEVLAEFAEVADEDAGAPPMEEGKRLTLTQRIMKMSICGEDQARDAGQQGSAQPS